MEVDKIIISYKGTYIIGRLLHSKATLKAVYITTDSVLNNWHDFEDPNAVADRRVLPKHKSIHVTVPYMHVAGGHSLGNYNSMHSHIKVKLHFYMVWVRGIQEEGLCCGLSQTQPVRVSRH